MVVHIVADHILNHFCTVLPHQVVEEHLHKGDCIFPFWTQSRWKLIFCFVSSPAQDANSDVENKQITKNPKQKNQTKEVRKAGSLKPLEDDSVLCAALGGGFCAEGGGWF